MTFIADFFSFRLNEIAYKYCTMYVHKIENDQIDVGTYFLNIFIKATSAYNK